MNKELFCHICDDYKKINIINKKDTYKVKDKNIEIDAQVCVCSDCGMELFDLEIDEQNIEKTFDKYRKLEGLLTTKEIKEIREMYGLSQRAFCKLLRWGEITMNRYEMGAIQDKAHNNILILLKNPHNMLNILDNNKEALSKNKENELRSRIDILLSEDAMTQLEDSVVKSISSKKDIYSGFKYFEFEKFKSLVVYFASNEVKLFKTKLMKLLWYCDNEFFKINTTSITGLEYARLPRGPVIENRELLLGLLVKEGVISLIEDIDTNGEYIVVEKDIDTSLNDDELKTAKEIFDKFRTFNSKKISDYSHDELAWKETKMGKQISYEYAKYIDINRN
jgi:putative zinc finger/helix-turn-helix YgiT family protein